jgi:hypothetical protein
VPDVADRASRTDVRDCVVPGNRLVGGMGPLSGLHELDGTTIVAAQLT